MLSLAIRRLEVRNALLEFLPLLVIHSGQAHMNQHPWAHTEGLGDRIWKWTLLGDRLVSHGIYAEQKVILLFDFHSPPSVKLGSVQGHAGA